MGPDGKLEAAQVEFSPIRADSGVMVPASCGALLWRLGEALGLTVVVKSTFSMEQTPMRPTSAAPVHCVDQVHPTTGMVMAPNDLVPRKAKVDVVAWARATQPKVRFVLTQIAHAAIDTSYNRSVGETSGFEPIGFRSPIRHSMLGNAELTQGRDRALVIPTTITPEFFQSAPPSQRIDALARDATITLEGVHATRPQMTVQLPSALAEGAAFGLTKKDAVSPLSFRADTVVIDVERMTVTVAWRAELGLIAVAQLPGILISAGVSTAEHRITVPSKRPDAMSQSGNLDATVMFGDASKPAAGGESPFAGTVEVAQDAPGPTDLPFQGKKDAPAALAWAEKMGDKPVPKGGTAMATPDQVKAALPFGEKKPKTKKPAVTIKGAKSNRMAAWAKAIEAGADQTKKIPSSKGGSSTLPFAKGKSEPPKPIADAWVQATGKSDGGTAVVFGGEREGSTLPFGGDLKAQRDAALAEAEAKRAEEAAQAAELEAKKQREEAERLAQEKLERDKAHELELAEKRREEEKQRFEEEQAKLREIEAERKRQARIQAEQDAADLEDDLYGGFGPNK